MPFQGSSCIVVASVDHVSKLFAACLAFFPRSTCLPVHLEGTSLYLTVEPFSQTALTYQYNHFRRL
jgi:hypothetical protein